MYSFFVLGIIPGTNIAISFQVWLALMVLLAVGVVVLKPRVARYIRENYIDFRREPIHASELHLRGV